MKKYIKPDFEFKSLFAQNVILTSDNDGSLSDWDTGNGLPLE